MARHQPNRSGLSILFFLVGNEIKGQMGTFGRGSGRRGEESPFSSERYRLRSAPVDGTRTHQIRYKGALLSLAGRIDFSSTLSVIKCR